MEYRYTGIILGKKDVGETDRIYSIYTKEAGKIRALAKGVRKAQSKLAGYLEPITQVEFFIAKSRGMGKITGAIVVENFPRIKKEWISLKKVFSVFKIIDKIITEEEKDEKVFLLLEEYLLSLEKINDPDKLEIITLGFLFKFISETGYLLEMDKCVSCGNKIGPDNNYFSSERGGVLCPLCQTAISRKIRITDQSIKILRIFGKNKISSLAKLKISDKDIKNVRLIINDAILWMIG